MSSAAVRRYWTLIASFGCVCCGGPAEIAHCHNGSIRERMQEPKAKGRKLPRYDWLVLPLCPRHGRNPYPGALDSNVDEWEREYGAQAEHIDALVKRTGVDVWAKANEGRKLTATFEVGAWGRSVPTHKRRLEAEGEEPK